MQQASRISDKTGFFLNGDLIEFNDTKEMFLYPQLLKLGIIFQVNLDKEKDVDLIWKKDLENYFVILCYGTKFFQINRTVRTLYDTTAEVT